MTSQKPPPPPHSPPPPHPLPRPTRSQNCTGTPSPRSVGVGRVQGIRLAAERQIKRRMPTTTLQRRHPSWPTKSLTRSVFGTAQSSLATVPFGLPSSEELAAISILVILQRAANGPLAHWLRLTTTTAHRLWRKSVDKTNDMGVAPNRQQAGL